MRPIAAKYVLTLASFAFVIALLSGCAWSIGSGPCPPPPMQPTRGQELLDLKMARDQGAITEEEYQRLKAQFLSHGSSAEPGRS